MFRARRSLFALLLVGILVATGAGCGEEGIPEPERAVVYGDVTFQGEPVKDGVIRFTSEIGPSAQGPIRDGSYKIDYKGGVPVGKCRVEIEAYEEQDISDVGTTLIEMPKKIGVQILPSRFNTESTLEVTVASDKVNQHDFHLTLSASERGKQ